MVKLDVLYDHYKDSFSLLQDSLKNRNKFTVLLFIIVFFQLLMAVSPDSIISLFIDIVNKMYEINISNQFMIIQCALWLLLLYFTMRYYQLSVYIERQYNYIYKIESDISLIININFDRESKNYLKSYPKMNNFIDFIYKWLFPTLYSIVILAKITVECMTSSINLYLLFDGMIAIVCFVLTILYLTFLHAE